jgi:hypothetical protein
VAADHRDTGAGRGDADLLAQPQDLAGLGHHLALLGRVVVAVDELLDLGEDVERDLMREDRGVGVLSLEHRRCLSAELLDRLAAGA